MLMGQLALENSESSVDKDERLGGWAIIPETSRYTAIWGCHIGYYVYPMKCKCSLLCIRIWEQN